MDFITKIIQTYQNGKKYPELQQKYEQLKSKLGAERNEQKSMVARIDELQNGLKEARESIKKLKKEDEPLPTPNELKNFFMYPEEQSRWTYRLDGSNRESVRYAFSYSSKDIIVAEAQEMVKKGGLRSKNTPTQVIDYCYRYVESNWDWDYTRDKVQFGKIEYWEKADKSLETMRGDCVAFDEEIITEDGIKTVEDIEVGDKVLSYNFDDEEYVYKPVTDKWDKGVREIKEVEFRNRQSIQVTEDHPMMARQHQSKSEYDKQYLSDIDMDSWYNRKVPSAKKLEVSTEDREWFTEDHAFMLGHFCAEGWTEDERRARSSGYELDQVIPLLDKHGIKYSENENGSGVPTVEFLDDTWRNLCISVKNNSFDITLPEWVLHLPERKIKRFVDGYFVGDGHIKHNGENNSFRVYSTSSEQLASDLCFMLNRLGEPVYKYKQLNHGGVGSEPIYRLHTNPNSCFCRDYGYDGMSETSIKNIDEAGKKQVYDFQVKDTHTFFFKNGIMTHNCDDKTIAMHMVFREVLKIVGMEDARWRIRLVASRTLSGGHAYNIWLAEDLEWYVVESTMDSEGSRARTWGNTPLRENNFYYDFYGFATPINTWRGDMDALEPYEDKDSKHFMER